MAMMDTRDILRLTSTILKSPGKLLWMRHDREADVLYINFEKPAVATDSELTDEDVIVRYHGEEVIGFTVLHASTRQSPG
jgi:uncharacterized protein YuzE